MLYLPIKYILRWNAVKTFAHSHFTFIANAVVETVKYDANILCSIFSDIQYEVSIVFFIGNDEEV